MKVIKIALVSLAVLCSVQSVAAQNAGEPTEQKTSASANVEEGKELAFNRKKGNCLACHKMEGGTLGGLVGPPLIAMKARFPKEDVLISQIWDARIKNPQTVMPPFGHHGILSKEEINLIVEFLYTL